MIKRGTITREKLYEQVWEIPGSQLAKRYGISDVALAKICRKLDVPRPYRGYWQRLKAGQSPAPTPLPQATSATVLGHRIKRQAASGNQSAVRTAKKKIPKFRSEIIVPDRLTKPHPLIHACREELKRCDNFRWRSPQYFNKDFVSIIVDQRAQARAFRIMDAFVKALEARGHGVKISDCYYGGGCAVIFGQEIRFDLRDREWSRAEDSSPAAASFGWSWEDKPVRVRRGLVFRVYKSWNNGCGTSHWRDGKRQRLEDLLDGILLQMTHLARSDHRYQIRSEKREREREEQERIRKQREAEIAAEKKRRRELVDAAESWRRSSQIREFIVAMEAKLGQDCAGSRKILTWARDVADEMDPLNKPSEELVNLLRKSELPSSALTDL